MLNWTIDGTSLRKHLQQDQFFDNSDTLNIIDDHNISDINDDAIKFFRASFEGLGINNIKVYYQVKGINDYRKKEIEELSDRIGINLNLLKAFLVFALDTFYPNNMSLEDIIYHVKRNKIRKSVSHALDFMNKMSEINITVTLHPFEPLGFEPPFHGRYWFTNEKGYIVDASLNTFTNGMIFAQLMDEENFDIIKRQLFENHVVTNVDHFEPLGIENIIAVLNQLHI